MSSIVLITSVLTEFRLEIPIVVLLTLIFLQDGYRSGLPNLPYLSFLDSIDVIAYLISNVSFGLVLYLEDLKSRRDRACQCASTAPDVCSNSSSGADLATGVSHGDGVAVGLQLVSALSQPLRVPTGRCRGTPGRCCLAGPLESAQFVSTPPRDGPV